MKIEIIEPPIKNGTLVKDDRNGKNYQVMAGLNSGEGWAFLCWEEGQKSESDCVTIEFEHLKKLEQWAPTKKNYKG